MSAPHTADLRKLEPGTVSSHAPRILLLYGSLRLTSYRVERCTAPGAIRGTTQFAELCPASATFMARRQ
jgi:hypothetical protein